MNSFEKTPNLSAEEHFNRGAEFVTQSRWQEAIREFEEALELNRDFAMAYYGLGLAYASSGRHIDAVREHQNALRLAPDFAAAHWQLGAAFLSMGHLNDAHRELTIAVELGDHRALELLDFVRAELSKPASSQSDSISSRHQLNSIQVLSPNELRGKLEEIFYYLYNEFSDEVKSQSYDALAQKQLSYSGEDYVDQLERNVVYLNLLVMRLNEVTARYLLYGEPKLHSHSVIEYIQSVVAPHALREVALHVNFIRNGCLGCAAHQKHSPYKELKDFRSSYHSFDYISELEPRYVYRKAQHRISEMLTQVVINNSQLAGIAHTLPFQDALGVIENRVEIHSSIWLGWYEAAE